MSTYSLPKLHNAMWPGLVGKGNEAGQEPAISLDRMLELTAAANINGQKFEGIDYFLVLPHTNPEASDSELIAIADKRIATLQTSDGRKPYFDATIPAGTYKNLQSAVKGAAVPTVTVDAIVVGNKDWMAKNPDEVKRIVAVKLN